MKPLLTQAHCLAATPAFFCLAATPAFFVCGSANRPVGQQVEAGGIIIFIGRQGIGYLRFV
ncbi:hypothetical protein EDC52_105179 [Biostraticola tofi]|uniref:Uncharacterized protein n=1 Tax=Biostraticola tofi TaxID=466109 RepID=A0A4R3YT26_9GAMM|nr:hypothetical protein EDC52_105179 [Biostraticola tofi]